MKRFAITLVILLTISLIGVSFVGLSEGVENSSSGNYFTPEVTGEISHISGQEFTVKVSEELQLLGEIRDIALPDRIAITLTLTGTRNKSLYFGADPLPSQEDIVCLVENELIRLGIISGIKRAVVSLPLEQT
ncbi:hypothetical protein [Persicirhabdus sediminis]|uniref:Uncharacterized protein n=2 Tax=Persicirhabdus sediminis TaxID=454144 RepID=A0A8J7MCY0_9BACT|nr:hypothetical protein [Persicirhabdus sediminis]MBK1790205.1 hypothetical protein [Persicirhabdus sediminis]